ncbi:lysophospholipid acyltransferase family protein [Noviherbaspirillum sp. CPCC 100848]|uniref:Lysophospholipid acyltransferase family protein n=1 Tax=Noviherbaspirillum album TaxID=3080276 RepID=A0ABU6J7T9_9BURK|nr:lysophospholipid acyltransferase family protein [Noviherbaspirillum sp. CPCC 100848]MEC4719264.1 lysophospholipid acyltransferase family protein [Noviherbaspirillum sp. CPCC 100848]
MLAFRLLRVALHLFRGLATCAFAFPRLGHAARQQRIQRWSARLVALAGVEVRVSCRPGLQPAARALIVSNHVSWLDIFVINSVGPCRFVAKSDIRDWPLIGWLCEKTGTIFISRGKLRDVRRIYQGLVASLHAGERVAFFPEGTTAAQGTLLPFHANLFEAAVEAEVPVQPYAVRYTGKSGELHAAADFIGDMTFVQSLVSVLRSGGMTAHLELLAPIETRPDTHRRELADAARREIADALGMPEGREANRA